MKALSLLVCFALFVHTSWCNSISIIGSRFIRPNRPYTVIFANPLNEAVNLRLSLQCDSGLDDAIFKKDSSILLTPYSGETVPFSVPSIDPGSTCNFSTINDGGEVIVNHHVELLIPKKTVSIFIQTDKPTYRPGDVLRFRIVVVDIDTKPVTDIKTIEVLIRDTEDNDIRHWKFAKLNMGVFESSYQLAAIPVLGKWSISVAVNDNNFSNAKQQSFEVAEYVLPKFAVKVWPTKTLLIEHRKISLFVESHYTFGHQPVNGKVEVELFLEDNSRKPSFTTTEAINGTTVVDLFLEDELEIDDEEGFKLVNITASVTDSLTNATVNITQMIPVYSKPYQISITPTIYCRPGEPCHFEVSVRDHTGLPADQGKTIKIFVEGEEYAAILDDQGLASFAIKAPEETESIDIMAVFDSKEYGSIGSIEGLSNSVSQYLQIHATEKITTGKTMSFIISSNEYIGQLWYFVATRGTIVAFSHVKLGKTKSYALNLNFIEAMARKATLVVFIIRNGTFIADHFNLNFGSFANDIQFELNDETYKPKEKVFIEGETQRDSIVFFHAHTKLPTERTEYGITKQGILDYLDLYIDSDDQSDVLDALGLFYKGNHTDDKPDFIGARWFSLHHSSSHKIASNAVLLGADYSAETWLWKKTTVDNGNKFQIEDSIPDAITTWYVTGFALSPTRGLGMMEPRNFTVRKSFYMIAHLPYSIKRAEVTPILVTLHNFLGYTVTAEVTLFNENDEIEFVNRSSNDDTRWTKTVILPSHQATPVSFLIKAKKLGEIAVEIEAATALASDRLEQMLRVTPESKFYIQKHGRFIELRSYEEKKIEISCGIPRDVDPGSVKIMASFKSVFSMLKSRHTESLISKANDDQNLWTFIRNTYVLDYINSMNSNVESTIQRKVVDSVIKGYIYQLNYKTSYGAFIIPGTNKDSIFLTALMANALGTASKYIMVDMSVIENAYAWLAGKQKFRNGCFDEVGKVVYSPIQNSSIALTAFVVVSIRENSALNGKYTLLVKRAAECLADNLERLSNNYHLALVAYALSLANHTKRYDCLDRLYKHSINDVDKGRYWDEGTLSTEIAGYALLSRLPHGDLFYGYDIYKWLNQQHYAGFDNTFVGLKAETKMAQLITKPSDLRVEIFNWRSKRIWWVDVSGVERYPIEHELPDTERQFNFVTSGIGFGTLSLTCQCSQQIGLAKPGFQLETELLNTTTYELLHLRVCLKFKAREPYQHSNKVLVEVYLPSGFVVNQKAVRDLSPDTDIRNTELAFNGSAVFVYYDSVSPAKLVCFEVTAQRQFRTAMHRPSYVVVYDIEDRDYFALATYEEKVPQVCDICKDANCTTRGC